MDISRAEVYGSRVTRLIIALAAIACGAEGTRWLIALLLFTLFCLSAGAQQHSPSAPQSNTAETREHFQQSAQDILNGLDNLIATLHQSEETAQELQLTLTEKEALAEKLRQSLTDYSSKYEQALQTQKQLEISLTNTTRKYYVSLICIPAALLAGLITGMIIAR